MYLNESRDFVTVGRMILALSRHWLSIAACTFVGTLLVAAFLLTLPNIYQSDSVLYIKIGRGTVSLDPVTTASGSSVSLTDSRQTEINSVKEMLTSRIVIERAVQSVGAERVMSQMPWYESVSKSLGTWVSAKTDWLNATLSGKTVEELTSKFEGISSAEVDELEKLEIAVERVAKKFAVRSSKDSYTLHLSCRAFSPTLARDLCQAIVDEYRRVHIEAHSVHGSLNFFEQQYAESKARLELLENELRDTKNSTQTMTISGKQELVLAEIKQLQSDLLKTSSEVAAARARDIELVAKSDSLPERMNTERTGGVANEATDKMRNQLFELEMLEKDLTNRYTKEHPLVLQVRDKLETARSIFESQSDDRTLTNDAINPVRQALELDRFRNLSSLEALKAQEQELITKIELAEQKAEKVNRDEVKLNDLERKVLLARADVMNYGQKQEEARLLDQLDSANLSDVSLPQPPSLVLEKVGPARGLLAVASAFCLLMASSAIAIFWDLRQDNPVSDQALVCSIDISNSPNITHVENDSARLVDSSHSQRSSSPWIDS